MFRPDFPYKGLNLGIKAFLGLVFIRKHWSPDGNAFFFQIFFDFLRFFSFFLDFPYKALKGVIKAYF